MTPVFPVVLSGGSGTRLWPLSRILLPKQFLSLVSSETMLQLTLLRLNGLPGFERPILISLNEHRFLAAEQARAVGIEPLLQILEPAGRNTAPATAIAALAATERSDDADLLVLPADLMIGDVPAFRALVAVARGQAENDKLVMFGIAPSYPETGYGYIGRGTGIGPRKDVFEVARFVNKPEIALAREFVADGRYLWNSGMFMFKASRYLEELGKFRPEILAAAREAWNKSTRDMDFIRLDEKAFLASPSDSIDYAVMEKTRDAVVVEADIGWSDIGSWTALWKAGKPDADGNVTIGDVQMDDTTNCYVRAESRLVAAVGVEDLIIVETSDAILVTHKNRSQDVKKTVEALKARQRDEYLVHKRVYRPWGYYEGLDMAERFQVKRIMVKPGSKLSLQMHHHRAEHWVVVSGTARVTRGEETLLLSENESTFIPLGTKHRLENIGKVPLHMIEVQSGSYLGEDDIVRFEDDYKRT